MKYITATIVGSKKRSCFFLSQIIVLIDNGSDTTICCIGTDNDFIVQESYEELVAQIQYLGTTPDQP